MPLFICLSFSKSKSYRLLRNQFVLIQVRLDRIEYFFSYFNLFFYGLAPPLCMLIFSLLTVRNINTFSTTGPTSGTRPIQRKLKRAECVNHSKRVLLMPTTVLQNANNSNARTTDRQMLRMLLVKVLVYTVTALIYSLSNIIIAARNSQSDNVSQVARTNLALSVVGVISTFGPCLSFYLFTLSSPLFRKELKTLFNRFVRTNN